MVTDINNINPPQPGKPRNDGVARDAVSSNEPAKATEIPEPSRPAETDTVELSSQAQELDRIKEELKTLPEVDAEKVDEVKARIANGTLSVDPEQIAAQILVNDQDF